MTEKDVVVDWEAQGKDALKRVLDNLWQPSSRLRSAADHYLHSYEGDNTPGVASSLNARFKGIETHPNPSESKTVDRMIKGGSTLAKNVEAQLAVIEGIANESMGHTGEFQRVSDRSSFLLGELLNANERVQFERHAQELEKTLQGEVKRVRNNATSGRDAASKVTRFGDEAESDLRTWWSSNYDPDYGQTISHHRQSLASFAETARDREKIFGDGAKFVLSNVPEDTADPVVRFIADFRSDRFPQETS